MFEHNHYVPVVKLRQAEYLALEVLPEKVKEGLTPIVEIQDIPVGEDGKYKYTLDDYLIKVGKQLDKKWNSKYPIFVESREVDSLSYGKEITDAYKRLAIGLDDKGVNAIPVTGVDRTELYQQHIRYMLSKLNGGICVRVSGEDCEDLKELENDIDDLLEYFELSHNEVDVVVDFEVLPLKTTTNNVDYVIGIINGFPNLNKWRTFSIVCTNFPKNFSEQKTASLITINRDDLQIWKDIISRSKELSRVPSFGDYTIQHPDMDIIIVNYQVGSANLRYATKDKWYIYKARGLKKHGTVQFREICKEVMSLSEYGGLSFCWGDKYIDECVNNGGSTGNPPTWRRIAFSRHLTLTANQVNMVRI